MARRLQKGICFPSKIRKRRKKDETLKKRWVLQKQREAALRERNEVANLIDVQIKNELDIEETKIVDLGRPEELDGNFFIETKIKEENSKVDCDPLRQEESDLSNKEECEPLMLCGPILINSPLNEEAAPTENTQNECNVKSNSNQITRSKTESGHKLIKVHSSISQTAVKSRKQKKHTPETFNYQPALAASKWKNFRTYGSAPLKNEQRKKLMEKHQLQLVLLKSNHKRQLEQMEHEKELIELKLANLKKMHALEISLVIKRLEKLQDN